MLRLNGLLLAVAAIAIAPASPARASVVTDNPGAWQLTFSDDFSGSTLDSSKWAHRGLGPRRSAINTADAVSVQDGQLTIKTYTQDGVHYTGMISTQGKFEQTHGYYEARMKFETTPGQWSAFWLQSPAYGAVGNPATAGTEIDIVEHRANNRNGVNLLNRYVSAVHWDGYDADHKQTSMVHPAQEGLGNGSWHTYAVKWTESSYQFYFDDKLMWTVNSPISQRPEYIILSSEVEADAWAGQIPAGGYGSLAETVTKVDIDYVRAYTAVAPPQPNADFDDDGDVDGADLLRWQRGLGATQPTLAAGNADGDGDVDADDLAIWRQQFGASATAALAVPEFAAGAIAPRLLALAAIAGVHMRSRR